MSDLTGEPTFEEFWSIYPRKIAKADARRSWDKAVTKIKIKPSDIVDGAKRYAAAKRGTEQQYIAHASTWLNQQRWADEHVEASAPEEPAYVPDSKALGIIQNTLRAQQIKKRLLRDTREHHQNSLQEAARRLNATETEIWSCMEAGFMGFDARAWKAACEEAVNGTPAPQFLPIERDHWIDGKERLESRGRAVAIKKQFAHSTY